MPSRPASYRSRLTATAATVAQKTTTAARAALDARPPHRYQREMSVCLVAAVLLATGAATASPPAPETVPTAAVVRESAPVPPPAPKTTVTEELATRTPNLQPQALPPAVAAPPPAPPAKVDRWLPTGTGMWLHEWHRSQGGDAKDVVARSLRSGFTHLYVQTGSTRKGWIGEEVLSELMPVVKDTDIKVIAWDFPKLIDPEADARRLARAAWWNRPGAAMVAAVAPDVETAAEGTHLSVERVDRYYRELRKALPARIAILATVPWPSEKRTGMYPYAATAPYSDAFVPMAYWYNRDPAVVTATSMTWLKRFGKPVMPVGQGYDGRIDAPYLAKDPDLAGSVTKFIDTARKHGAQSISLWSWQTTDGAPWTSLKKAAGTIGPKPPAPPTPAAQQPRPLERVEEKSRRSEAEKKAKATAPGRKHDRQREADTG